MKKINCLTPTQAAYLAGLIDGEGHVRVTTGRVVCGITQSEKGIHLLHLAKEWIGAGTIGLHRAAQGNWQSVYRYRLHSTKFNKDLFNQLSPYLHHKNDAFLKAIELAESLK